MKKFGLFCLCFLLIGCANEPVIPEETQPFVEEEEPVEEDKRVQFAAVGDNLIHGAVFGDPYHVNGEYRDYTSMYDEVKYLIEDCDIANINQETILGGTKLGLSHYPMFNSPQEIGDAIVKAGFNWISQASNHSFDRGEEAIISAMDYWDGIDDVVTTGLNRSEEEAKQIRVIEKEGIRFGLLNYTYGLNGFEEPEGKEYLVNNIDREQIQRDVEALKPNCDVMIASMHWGQEYQFMQNEEQEELAQFLADLGVQVIIGAHPHVIQPVQWLTGKEGNQTLVYYSLGNFLSAQDRNDTMLGGLARWEIVKDGKTKEYRIENAEFYPTVTYFIQGYQNFKTYALKDYDESLVQSHGLSAQYDMSKEYFVQKTNEVMQGVEGVRVVY